MLSDRRTFIRCTLALIVAFGGLLIGEHIYLEEYLTTDENSYMFQAWLFLQGKFNLPCPSLKEAFFHRMIICDEQVGWLSRYPPAHSVWLIPGIAVGYPRLMTAIAGFLAVWFLTKAGEKLEIPTWCTGLLLLISPYFWLMQGSVLSHTSGLASTALMLWAYLVWLKDRKTLYAAIAGLAWAFLFLNRSYTALWIALPFGIDALVRLAQHRNRTIFVGTVAFAACSSLGIILYLLYNYAITGDALMPTFLQYNATEGPGFGMVNGKEHTPAIGWEFLKYNFSSLNVNLWGFSGSLLIWLGLSIIGWRKGITPLLLSATFLVWISYSAFWFRGILEVPPIYYYETLVFVIISTALGLKRLFELDWPLPQWSKVLMACLLVVTVAPVAFETFKVNAQVVTKRNSYKHEFQRVIRGVPPNSIVVLKNVHKDILQQSSWNPKGLGSDPLILRDKHGVMQVIPHLFPNRPVYLVSGREPEPAQAVDNINGSRTMNAAHMRATTGDRTTPPEQPGRFAHSPEHGKGFLGAGIKQYVIPGVYEVKFTVKAEGQQGARIGHVEVIDSSSGSVLGSRDLVPGDNKVVLKINPDKVSMAVPRVFFNGEGRLEFYQVEVRLVSSL